MDVYAPGSARRREKKSVKKKHSRRTVARKTPKRCGTGNGIGYNNGGKKEEEFSRTRAFRMILGRGAGGGWGKGGWRPRLRSSCNSNGVEGTYGLSHTGDSVDQRPGETRSRLG